MSPESLRAQGDRDLAAKLLEDPDVRRAVEKAKDEGATGARRHLLATSVRLTDEMAPDIATMMSETRDILDMESPVETYVYPSPTFNAAAVRPEDGRLFVMLSSSLLEGFSQQELRFVVGHELGHHVFGHHGIPTGRLLTKGSGVRPPLALQLFAWQRYAEVSCDRAGLIAAGGLTPAATALFKLSSGLATERVEIRIDQFLEQLGDLREEANKVDTADAPPRSDWFSTHPFSPLRLRAAELFSKSELVEKGGMPMAELEAQVQELMTLMDPSYLQAKTEIAETMRRLLFAGGILVAAAAGGIEDSERTALEELLGANSVPEVIDVTAVRESLDKRIEQVNAKVPPLRRAQIIRDMHLVAVASGQVRPAEQNVIAGIAERIGVSDAVIRAIGRSRPRLSQVGA